MTIEQSIQEGIRNILKQKVSKLKCPEHNKGTKVDFTKNPYSFEFCCESFRKTVTSAIKS